ncbi:hypothetical protein ACNOYE_37935 [Nannocystaceae bacterium ST9]
MLVGLSIALLLAEPVSVEWSGADLCPGAELALEQAISSYLGEAPRERSELVARLRIEPGRGAGARIELSLASPVGEERHELSGSSCAQVLDRAALLIAGAIDPFVFGWPPPSDPLESDPHEFARPPVQRPSARVVVAAVSREPESAIAIGPTRRPPPPVAPLDSDGDFGPLELVEEGPGPRTSGAIAASITGFAGLFAQVGGGAEVEAAVERGALRWQLTGAGWFGGRFRSSEGTTGADLFALGLSMGPCGVPSIRRVRFPLCAVAGVGFVSAEAVGTLEPRRSTRPWAWVGGDARAVIVARPRLGVGLGVGVYAALIRPAWAVADPDATFRIPPVSGVLRLTFEVRGLGQRGKSSGPSINSRSRGQ